ncbi:alpha-soluble NSF attachment protein-like [Myiozetetes cayanensis]|uniref:alpha-soluble NSF attachment protein-like n=1 Tax=Myiozetetes cayanensis TaxID=478635 RepID=UPI00215E1594|nr:alpha-soluble NSF attachment protein-like [Myiozetetes cayanensis]
MAASMAAPGPEKAKGEKEKEKEEEAKRLLSEADRKVRGASSFLGALFGGSSRLEEACECYTRAANLFKMAKNWSEAGSAFCRASRLHEQLQSKPDAASRLVDAANAFKKCDPQEAVSCLLRAIDIYTDMGRFTVAAKQHVAIAEIYEGDLVDVHKVRPGIPGKNGSGMPGIPSLAPWESSPQKNSWKNPAWNGPKSRDLQLFFWGGGSDREGFGVRILGILGFKSLEFRGLNPWNFRL